MVMRKRMKRTPVIFILIVTIGLYTACGKGGNGGSNQPAEVNLAVDTDPANGTVQAPSLGPFNLKVTITSAMPPNGVKIELSAKKDDGSNSAAFFTSTINSTNSVNNFSLTNTPSNVQSLVEIKVTSLTKASNQWTGSYRYSRK